MGKLAEALVDFAIATCLFMCAAWAVYGLYVFHTGGCQ